MSVLVYNLFWGSILVLVLISLIFLVILVTAAMMNGTCTKNASQESYSSGIARCQYQGYTPILTCSYHAFTPEDPTMKQKEEEDSFVS